jgi:hypothetical protein
MGLNEIFYERYYELLSVMHLKFKSDFNMTYNTAVMVIK